MPCLLHEGSCPAALPDVHQQAWTAHNAAAYLGDLRCLSSAWSTAAGGAICPASLKGGGEGSCAELARLLPGRGDSGAAAGCTGRTGDWALLGEAAPSETAQTGFQQRLV